MAELHEVVDLAVLDRHNIPGLAEKRLLPARRVDDRESAHAETDVVAEPEPVLVGASMDEACVHRRDELPGHRTAVEVDYADDSAHMGTSLGGSPPAAG